MVGKAFRVIRYRIVEIVLLALAVAEPHQSVVVVFVRKYLAEFGLGLVDAPFLEKLVSALGKSRNLAVLVLRTLEIRVFFERGGCLLFEHCGISFCF